MAKKLSIDDKGKWIVGKNGKISQGPWKGYTPKEADKAIDGCVKSQDEVRRNMRKCK